MYFDTHCHLNFGRFKKNLDEVIQDAREKGVEKIVVPGTDLVSSQRAVEIAHAYDGIYAAVGIHPHHVFDILEKKLDWVAELEKVQVLMDDEKVVAVGEAGLDRHMYEQTKYEKYDLREEFIELQKKVFVEQIKLAIEKKLSLIIHNREATDDLLGILDEHWHEQLKGRTVFHCCEADMRLLQFAKEHHVYIGVDGDVTYDKKKQGFVKEVPLELLVLETDSPFLLPEPLRSEKKYPNVPGNVDTVSNQICILNLKLSPQIFYQNSINLFSL